MVVLGKIRAGDSVRVLNEADILATLDEKGTLEGLLFAPEMREYCGKRFRVLTRVKNIMIEGKGIGSIRNTVILNGPTCNGSQHAGCARACLFLWKEAWLKPDDGRQAKKPLQNRIVPKTLETVHGEFFSCQATSLSRATRGARRFAVGQRFLRLSSKDIRPTRLARMLLSMASQLVKRRFVRTPILAGRKGRTPLVSLGLKPGELVKVKDIGAILETLDSKGRNRGLSFTPEMLKFCGKKFKVLKRLDCMIFEATGQMRQIANTVLLEDVFCDGTAHGYCPRNCYCMWREAWLQRVNNDKSLFPNKSSLHNG